MNTKPSLSLLLKLNEGLAGLGITLPEETKEKLIQYVELLSKWNSVHNLTAVSDKAEMVSRHILDSLTVYPFLARTSAKTILDVGTGAGLPGIVLALAFPDRAFVLLDSQQKKINFVQHVVLSLKIENASPVCQRVEAYKPAFQFDWVISRAYASLRDFAISAGHLCNGTEGRLVAMKGKLDLEEKEALPKTYAIESCEGLEVPGVSASRSLVFLKKGEQSD